MKFRDDELKERALRKQWVNSQFCSDGVPLGKKIGGK